MSLSRAEANEMSVAVPALAAEDDTFESLYRIHFPRLVRLLRRRTGDAVLAEDLAQETLLRAYVSMGGIDVTRPLWPWLKTIATRLVIDHARCNGREVLCEPQAKGLPDELGRFEDDLIHQAMGKLTGSQKAAISLRYLDDWKPAEAAMFLGINRIAFEQLLLRARRRLRAEYARLSDKALGIFVLPYRRLRRLFARITDHVRDGGAGAGPVGTIGVDAAAQLVSGMLAILTAVTVAAGSLPAGEQRDLQSAGQPANAEGSQKSRGSGSDELSDPGSNGGRPVVSAGAGNGGNEAAGIVDRVTDPNEDVKQPEDARITSIAFGPGSGSDQMVYAAGRTECGARCSRVLFASSDGGETWTRLDAEGFEGDSLILPFSDDGQTIFAMGPTGLQVSRDGGRSFKIAAFAGATFAVGSAAVSPAFHQGDPTVLIGAQTLLRYRDNTTTVEPYPAPLTGPLNPAYSPAYPADPRIFVGGVKIQPQTNEAISTIYTCNGPACTHVELPGATFAPQIRLSDNFIGNGIALAFDKNHLFLSRDGLGSFSEISVAVAGTLRDAAYSDKGSLFVSVTTADGEGARLLISRNGGRSWEMPGSSLFQKGAAAIALSARRVMVALGDKGLACSTDDGATWSRHCS